MISIFLSQNNPLTPLLYSFCTCHNFVGNAYGSNIRTYRRLANKILFPLTARHTAVEHVNEIEQYDQTINSCFSTKVKKTNCLCICLNDLQFVNFEKWLLSLPSWCWFISRFIMKHKYLCVNFWWMKLFEAIWNTILWRFARCLEKSNLNICHFKDTEAYTTYTMCNLHIHWLEFVRFHSKTLPSIFIHDDDVYFENFK